LLRTEAIIQSRHIQNCRISENKIRVQKFQFVVIVKKHENNQPNINLTNKKKQMLYKN